jgi:tetratricopeptide (TPR) repeat protein
MSTTKATDLIRKGMAALHEGSTLVAMVHFEDAMKLDDSPTARSFLAFCLAKEQHQFGRAATLCLSAMQEEPNKALHYLNLGRIYLLAGEKTRAIKTFRKGLKLERNRQIIDELKKLGLRQPPVVKTLHRDNPLNKCLGILFQKLGMR